MPEWHENDVPSLMYQKIERIQNAEVTILVLQDIDKKRQHAHQENCDLKTAWPGPFVFIENIFVVHMKSINGVVALRGATQLFCATDHGVGF